MLPRNSKRTKALIAIAFASGSANLLLAAAAAAEEKIETPQVLLEQIQESHYTPSYRAYFLLDVAQSLILYGNISGIDKRLILSNQPWKSVLPPRFRIHEELVVWANRLTLNVKRDEYRSNKFQPDENKALANDAIMKALKLTEREDYQFAKQNLRYIASLLFLKEGNTVDSKKICVSLEAFFHSCETNPSVKEDDVHSATSILNSEAYGIIPVNIPEQQPVATNEASESPTIQFTESQFKQCEALKLRAIAMADRLTPASDTRRRVHRDMSLWYLALGKAVKADQQKEILCQLLGRHDDTVLWPVHGFCGALTWWTPPGTQFGGDCGMG